MSEKFEQISLKSGFMKHNGGLLVRKLSEKEFQFKSIITNDHLNSAGITHGGYIASLIDAGSGSAAHKVSENLTCVTVSLEIKFISPTKKGDEIFGFVKILKKTKSMVFILCHLECNKKIVASASGVWKILRGKPTK
jgi:uncharacterized protein (TIGR00369 family)